jgi:hypothetical protein
MTRKAKILPKPRNAVLTGNSFVGMKVFAQREIDHVRMVPPPVLPAELLCP